MTSGFFSAVLLGEAEAEDFEADAVGEVDAEAERPASRLVEVPARPVSAVPEAPPCSEVELLGVSAACTLSPGPVPPPSR